MTDFLFQYPSLTSPAVALLVGSLFLLLVALFALRPSMYVPALLMSAPFPKLFALGLSESTTAVDSYVVTTQPGISAIEIVAMAGVCALLFRKGASGQTRGSNLAGALWLCIASIGASLVVGALLNPEIFHWSQLLYATRHAATFLCFFVARRYSRTETNSRFSVSSAFEAIRRPGQVVILLGILFYVFYGREASTAVQITSLATGGGAAEAQRNFMWFFDYSYDFGMYITLVAILNVALTLRGRRGRKSTGHSLLWLLICAASILFLGERGNVLIFFTMLFLFAYFASRVSRGLNRVIMENMVLYAGFVVIAIALVFFVLSPQGIIHKLQSGTINVENGAPEAIARQIGLPDSITTMLTALPIGDFSIRLILNAGSILYFLKHLYGTGFGGELYGVGWFSHYELTTVAVEQGVLGLVCYCILLRRLIVLGFRSAPSSTVDELYSSLVIRALILTFVAATLIYSLTAIFMLKFSMIFWTLLGVYDVSLFRRARANAVLIGSTPAYSPVPVYLGRGAAPDGRK